MGEQRGAVVVTGASSGIGKACALALDKLGHRVFAGVRKEADGKALAAQASPGLTPVILDVADEGSIAAAARAVADALAGAPLLGLVNNAGIAVAGPQEFLALADWRRQFEVNVFGVVAVTRAFLPLLRRAERRARIVNMSSISGRVAAPFLGPYAASKHALEALTASLRLELHPWGIHAATIEPGSVLTPVWDKAEKELGPAMARLPPEARERYGAASEAYSKKLFARARKEGCPPERVAEAVVHALTARRPRRRYLVGADARAVTALRWLVSDRVFEGIVLRDAGLA